MAVYAAMATGNFGTAGTWNRATNAPSISPTSNFTISTTPTYGAAFTAPNTTNKVTGLLVYYTGTSGAVTMTATLQESTVDTACTATITLSNVDTNTWIFFTPASPYTFTTTTASAYRWKMVTDTSTASLAQTNAAGNFCTISLDDRTSVPVSGDSAYIIAQNNTGTSVVVTMDGTRTVGPNSTAAPSRTTTPAIIVGKNCQLQMDTTATSQLTLRGHVYVESGGEFSCGTVASPLPSSYTASIYNQTNNGTIYFKDGAKGIWQGEPKAYQKTTVASGSGTTVDPLITSDPVDWNVGDYIVAAPATDSATNYNETEAKYIKTKNSSTSYVLSNTSGGAEAGYTYDHTGAMLGNFSSNIIIRGNSPSVYIGFVAYAQTSAGNINIDWVAFSNIGNGTFLGAIPTNSVAVSDNCNIDNCTAYNGPAGLFYLSSCTDMTYTNLLTYNTATTLGLAPAFANIGLYSSSRTTLTDCHSFASNGYGIGLDQAFSCTVEDCSTYACTNTTATGAGFAIANSGLNTIDNLESNAHYSGGIYIGSGPDNVFNSCLLGTKADMPYGVYMGTGFSTVLFNDTTVDATGIMGNYANMTLGSEIRFNRLDDTDNNHRWYTVYGYGKTEDTEVRTADSLAVRLTPENSTPGFSWEFQIPAEANSIVAFFGYFMKNTAFSTDDAIIELWLPGSTSADASYTLTDTYDTWQAVAMSVSNTQSVDGLATVKVIGKTTTSAAYLYCDDFYNAGNTIVTTDKVTGLDVWFEGKPASILTPSAVSPAALWTFPTANLTTPNTTGKKLVDAEANAELASIK